MPIYKYCHNRPLLAGALVALITMVLPVASIVHAQELTSPDEVVHELLGENTGESLDAAWRRVEASLRSEALNSPPRAAFRVPEGVIQRFLGFIEGALHVSLPANFSNNLQRTNILWNGRLRFPIQEFSPWAEDASHDGFPGHIPKLSVVEEGGLVRVATATGGFPTAGVDGTTLLPRELSEAILPHRREGIWPISSVVFTQTHLFVAVVDEFAPTGKLYCISLNDGKMLWSREMLAYAGDSYRGSGSWFTEMRVNSRIVVLFHCSESSFSIEAFDFEGNNQFQTCPTGRE